MKRSGENMNGKRKNNQKKSSSLVKDNQKKKPKKEYPAVCSRCNKKTVIPFKPDGIRPVFCDECFIKEREENQNKDMKISKDNALPQPIKQKELTKPEKLKKTNLIKKERIEPTIASTKESPDLSLKDFTKISPTSFHKPASDDNQDKPKNINQNGELKEGEEIVIRN